MNAAGVMSVVIPRRIWRTGRFATRSSSWPTRRILGAAGCWNGPRFFTMRRRKSLSCICTLTARCRDKRRLQFRPRWRCDCDTVDGDYQYLKSFRPLGHESRDIGQFIDDDGTAYLIFEDRPFGFRIAKLVRRLFERGKGNLPDSEHMEGGALVHYQRALLCHRFGA